MDDTVYIQYEKLVEQSLRNVCRAALKQVEEKGLEGQHHFYISFLSDFPGVHISKQLKKQYPEEMAIVIQHQFEDLRVEEDSFSLSLSFSGVLEELEIPFESITSFSDPFLQFALRFSTELDDELIEALEEESVEIIDDLKIGKSSAPKSSKKSDPPKEKESENNLVSLDGFRKQKEKED